MIHIIILVHFVCVTIGCIFFWDLLHRTGLQKKYRFLFWGLLCSNLFFILDTFNLYSRHWWDGYTLGSIIGTIGSVLLILSVPFFLLFLIQTGKETLYRHKKSFVTISILILLCILIQTFDKHFEWLRSFPWACMGYILFCIAEFIYIHDRSGLSDTVQTEMPRQISFSNISVPTENTSGDTVTADDAPSISPEAPAASPSQEFHDLLTKRETEIADLICEGKNNKEIAEILVISQNTVRNHIYNIYRKLDVKNKVELINKLKQ